MATAPFPEPNVIIVNVVGMVGIVTSLLYRIPQIFRTYKTKSAMDISIHMLIIQNISYIAYIVYGVLVWDWVYIISSVLSFAQNIIILLMRRHYSKADVETATPPLPSVERRFKWAGSSISTRISSGSMIGAK